MKLLAGGVRRRGEIMKSPFGSCFDGREDAEDEKASGGGMGAVLVQEKSSMARKAPSCGLQMNCIKRSKMSSKKLKKQQ